MQINTSQPLLNMAGKSLQTQEEEGVLVNYTLGKGIADILLAAKNGGKMKMFILAEKCYKNSNLEVDEADLSLIKSAVENTEILNNLYTGQILKLLEEVK